MKSPTEVLAAGVICHRQARGSSQHSLQVLLVHRPGHEDWSWPKGKLESGETLPECAVRETAEETGVRVRLGRPLPEVGYNLPDGRPKRVVYWAASPRRTDRPTAPTTEIDRTAWLGLDEAEERLTRDDDRLILKALRGMADDGALRTRPLLTIRHATARPRDAWALPDADRPLVSSGRRQAMALAGLLSCWQPEYLLSSPWLRCQDTLRPYLALSEARLRVKGGLSEDGFRRDPGKVGKHLAHLLGRDGPVGLCTHRPLLPSVFETLRSLADQTVAAQFPDISPYLSPGEVLVTHLARSNTDENRVVAVERHTPVR
ncbi:MAG: hydrolase [Actinomycetota bacterium]|nr:hydrolase [Actinomycetota bacterium]